MNTYVILNGYRDSAVWMRRTNRVRFLIVVLDEERSIQKIDGYTRRLARSHFDAVVCTKKGEDQLRRTTRDLHTRVAKSIEVDGGIFGYLLWTAKIFHISLSNIKLHWKYILTVCNFSFLITIHNGFVFVDSNISNSVTIHNYTYDHTNTFSNNDQYHHPSPPKRWPFLLNHPVYSGICLHARAEGEGKQWCD